MTIQFTKADIQKHSSDNELLLSSRQILKLQKAHNNGTGCVLIMRRKQIDANMGHEGGFLPILAGLAGKLLPVILGGLTSGVLSGAVERVMKKGDRFFLHQNNHFDVLHVDGNRIENPALTICGRPAGGTYINM